MASSSDVCDLSHSIYISAHTEGDGVQRRTLGKRICGGKP